MASCALGTNGMCTIVTRGRRGRTEVPGSARKSVVQAHKSWKDSEIQIGIAGCDASSSSSSSSVCGRASSLTTVKENSRVSWRSRNVVCEVAVKFGSTQSSEGQGVKVGARIRVKVPLTVYHVPKTPELNLQGLEGEVKDVVLQHLGKTVSATLPIKVQFFKDVDGKQIKFFAHFKDDEVEVVE